MLPVELLELAILKEVEADVTTKMATPTEIDSKLLDAQLESCKRATKALEDLEMRVKPLRLRRLETRVWWIAQKTLLNEHRAEQYAIYTTQ